MTDKASLLYDSAARLRRTDTLTAAQEVIVAFATALGFDRLVFSSLRPRPQGDDLIDELFFVHGNWSESDNTSDLRSYLRHCPITRHVLDIDEPFFWTKVPSRIPGRMTYRVVRQARDFGAVGGLQIPLFGRGGLEGAAAFGSARPVFDEALRLVVQSFSLQAFAALKRLRSLPTAPLPQALSEREREVLQWVALGRQQADIAVILAIAEKTVEHHLRAARQRLGAASTAHAIALALQLGDIEI
ncbi:PA1136 family autoinducer-binding transcriptional regulator [Pseudomonas oryzihabitans]|uniref:LuxR family quorum sensing-dependent transcriptional regulator n=1 Tax=Pseudomonas oryzihabitans TaxID=47885 RepID=A0AAJ2BFP5_9PSED|nr:PA1136 family autoinducer-binding transcriptional regulator [Pseudomonas psychrotolerans]MDR6233373.1 LuxR family quorum sensing-dependent transcriptional regulator [Pseudomonas psychrotolerans]MDR6357599.1 LuxR family quorum sensing-dependent transcriptional regulator [Pseudomonas psychrotolerans]